VIHYWSFLGDMRLGIQVSATRLARFYMFDGGQVLPPASASVVAFDGYASVALVAVAGNCAAAPDPVVGAEALGHSVNYSAAAPSRLVAVV
jgi:hypothetical protein